jgi:hypothetical protein
MPYSSDFLLCHETMCSSMEKQKYEHVKKIITKKSKQDVGPAKCYKMLFDGAVSYNKFWKLVRSKEDEQYQLLDKLALDFSCHVDTFVYSVTLLLSFNSAKKHSKAVFYIDDTYSRDALACFLIAWKLIEVRKITLHNCIEILLGQTIRQDDPQGIFERHTLAKVETMILEFFNCNLFKFQDFVESIVKSGNTSVLNIINRWKDV